MASKREILYEAAKLFDSKGYHKTSVADISAAVGLKKGSLYYYIQSKEQLLYEIHEQFIDALQNRINNHLSVPQANSSATAKLSVVIREHAQVMDEFRPQIRVFFREMDALSPENLQVIAAKRKNYKNMLVGLIEEGIENKEFVPLDPNIVALAILGIINWMYQWHRPDGYLSTGEIAELFEQMILQGLSTKSAS